MVLTNASAVSVVVHVLPLPSRLSGAAPQEMPQEEMGMYRVGMETRFLSRKNSYSVEELGPRGLLEDLETPAAWHRVYSWLAFWFLNAPNSDSLWSLLVNAWTVGADKVQVCVSGKPSVVWRENDTSLDRWSEPAAAELAALKLALAVPRSEHRRLRRL